jgi:hypothetical protein
LTRAAKQLALIALVALVVGAVAVADHTRKNRQMQRADVALWYCRSDNIGCGTTHAEQEWVEHKSEHIEAGWQRRERAYTAALAVLALAGALSIIAGLRRGSMLGSGRSRQAQGGVPSGESAGG